MAQAEVCYHLRDAEGHKLAAARAPRSLAGWSELTKMLTANQLAPSECLVAVEATGDLHLPWCEALHAAGAPVLALNPLVARRTTPVENAIRDQKADPIDAEGLAVTAQREGAALERFTYRSAPAAFGLRKLLAAQGAVRTALTNLKKHTGNLQQLCFPELKAVALSEGRQQAVLLRAATPAQFLALPFEEQQALADDKTAELLTAARGSFVPAQLAAAAATALQSMVRVVQQLTQSLRQLDREVTQQAAVAVPPARLALAHSLPGFGAKTTPLILACIPDQLWDRAQKRKQQTARLQALFGIEPRRRQSGKWTGHIKLSKRGIRAARTAMYQIAFCSVIHDPEMRAYYLRLTKQAKKPHKVALFDLARKHLRRLVAVISSGQPFTPRPPLAPCPP